MVETAYIMTSREKIDEQTILGNFPSRTMNPYFHKENVAHDVDLRKHLCREAWDLLCRVYHKELAHGKFGIRRRVADRPGLNPVNGFGRKLKEIR